MTAVVHRQRRRICSVDGKQESALKLREESRRGFTLLELVIVIAVILILAGLVLTISGYVQEKSKRARAEAEIAAISAALESYKADNGIYPSSAATTALDARTLLNAANYRNASLYLFTQLSGLDASQAPVSGARSYFSFKPQMLGGTRDANGNLTAVTHIADPFGNSYGYSTIGNPQANPTPAATPVGYNPTYDLWSNGAPSPTPSSSPTPTPQDKWIKNW